MPRVYCTRTIVHSGISGSRFFNQSRAEMAAERRPWHELVYRVGLAQAANDCVYNFMY